MSERTKLLIYRQFYGHQYFWRTNQQQEIDYLEEQDGLIDAFEFKWNAKVKVNFPKTFLNAYPASTTKLVNPANYEEFLLNVSQNR